MVKIIEAVDHDTFSSNAERKDEAKKKIIELGKIFKNAGAYISQRLDFIDKGKYIATALAEEFYDYGQSLISGEKLQKEQDVDKIASHNLTVSEIETVDKFLAGESLYESRQKRVEKAASDDPNWKEDFYEEERRKTLAQFFRVSEKAFDLKNSYLAWSYDTPIHNAFIAKIEKALAEKIETPKRELTSSIFKRGMELLRKKMPFDELPQSVKKQVLHLQNGEKNLREALQITRLKYELEIVKKSKNPKKISAKERQIANKIQLAVSGFPYKLNAHNPSEMIANQYINCVGASMLGGALMQEAGLNYLIGSVPQHSILFLVTTNGSVEWRDMQNNLFNEDLIDEEIVGKNKKGLPLKVADIIEFSKKPSSEGLMFDIKNESYRNKLSWVKKGQRQFVIVSEPEYGQKIQVLNNTASMFVNLGDEETDQQKKNEYYNQAMTAYRETISFSNKYFYAYEGLGTTLFKLGRYEEAIEKFREVMAINEEHINVYFNIGAAFLNLKQYKKAIAAFQKFVDLIDKIDLSGEQDDESTEWTELVKVAKDKINYCKNMIAKN